MGVNCECRYSLGTFGGNDFESKDSLNFNSDNPKIMTYHSAKGLQFETVFLPMCTASDEERERKPLYVAMTRSYQDLYIMHSGNLSPFCRNVPVSLYETSEADKIDDI
jgi:superfamily I DNA/RNA helicase